MKPTFKMYDHDYNVDDMFEDEDLTDAMCQVIDGASFAWCEGSRNSHLTFSCDEGTVIMTRDGELYGTDDEAINQFVCWIANAYDYVEE